MITGPNGTVTLLGRERQMLNLLETCRMSGVKATRVCLRLFELKNPGEQARWLLLVIRANK